MAKEMYKLDLYSILGVSEDASEKEIVKGYRKNALKCHPDKNPDNPKAAELFQELSNALGILTDAAAKAAYDQSRKAKKAAQERTRVLDSKRKKLKEDLEAREQAAFEKNAEATSSLAEKKLQAEIERLRKEGSRLLEQEQQRLKEELKGRLHEDKVADVPLETSPRIKLKWKAQKGDLSNGGYNSNNLTDILGSFGKISVLIISSKRNGSAIVEFESSGVSSEILDETGLKDNPFSITWLSGEPSEKLPDTFPEVIRVADDVTRTDYMTSVPTEGGVFFHSGNSCDNGSGQQQKGATFPCADSDKNFENLVLMRMRQAEERKKLIEQMMKDDKEDE